jgi:hypothetical protein
LTRCKAFNEERGKPTAAVDDPVYAFLNERGIFTSYNNVQSGDRGGRNQNGRDNAEEGKNDQHLPSNCPP